MSENPVEIVIRRGEMGMSDILPSWRLEVPDLLDLHGAPCYKL